MTRSARPYADGAATARQLDGLSVDAPVTGHYRMRLCSGGVMVGVRIWFGQPLDPETGEEMDRSLRWQAQCNGRPIDLERVWPQCAGQPISAQEYAYLSSRQDWGEQHAPSSPEANPRKPVNWLTAPIDI